MRVEGKVVVLRFTETEFELLLRRASEFLRQSRQSKLTAKPFVVGKKHSSAA
jgi:hypothetical protein